MIFLFFLLICFDINYASVISLYIYVCVCVYVWHIFELSITRKKRDYVSCFASTFFPDTGVRRRKRERTEGKMFSLSLSSFFPFMLSSYLQQSLSLILILSNYFYPYHRIYVSYKNKS
jgi:hypothetical protein